MMSLLMNALRKRQQAQATEQLNQVENPVQRRRYSIGWVIALLLLVIVILLVVLSVMLFTKKPVVSALIERRQSAAPVDEQQQKSEIKERLGQRRASTSESSAPVEEVISEDPVQEPLPPVVTTTEASKPDLETEPAPRSEAPSAEFSETTAKTLMSIQDASMHTEYEQAKAMIDRLDYQSAIRLLNNKQLAMETHGDSAVLLANLYLQLNQLAEARAYLSEVIEYHTEAQVKLVSLLGETYFRQGDYQSAITLLNQGSPSLTEYPSYYTLLARAYLNAGESQAALEILQQVVSVYPSNGSYWVALGLAYQKAGDNDSAVVAYNKAAELNDDNPQALLFINQQLRFLQS